MPMREQLIILPFLLIQCPVLYALQYMPDSNEKYDQRNFSDICGRLGGLAIMNDDMSTKTVHGIQMTINLDVCSSSKTQDKEDVSLLSKSERLNRPEQDLSKFATTFTNLDVDDIHQLLNWLEDKKQSKKKRLIRVGEKLKHEGYKLLHFSSHESTRMLSEGENEAEAEKSFVYFNIFMAVLCVTVAALAAGLTMGMMSIDPLLLKIKLRGGTDEEREQAKKIYPLVQDHHRLLVTLLLMNSISNEALPLFLDELVPAYVAILMSVTLVLFFGEIIPSAIFSGPNQMKIAAALCPLVRVIIFILFPIAAPIAKMLDVFLGHSDASIVEFKRGELKSLVQFMYREQNNKHGMDKEEGDFEHTHDNSGNGFRKSTSYIEGDEINVIEGALSMTTLTAENIVQPLAEVFAIEKDDELDEQKIDEIYNSGFSRIPVYEKNRENICGIILTKNLIPKMLEDEKITMSSIQKSPLCVDSNMNLIDLLNLFQTGRSKDIAHMAIVCKNVNKAKYAISSGSPIPKSGSVIGVITLEDVIERLIKKEILDETDAENSPIVMSLTRGVSSGRKGIVRVNSLRRSGSMHSSVRSTNGREKYQKDKNETSSLSNDSCRSIFVDNESDREIRSERNLTLLHEDEAKVLEGALSLKTKFVADILTNLGRIYAVNSSGILNKRKILEICSSGFSRVPVYTGSVANICGYFLTKRLILIKNEDQIPVSSIIQQKPILVRPDLNLVDLLSKFLEEKNHMAVVCNNVKLAESAFREDSSIPLDAGVLGVVTLEDVIEEIIQEEIYDEKDVTKIEKDKEFIKHLKSKRLSGKSTPDGLFSGEITSDIIDESSPLLC